MNFLYCWHAQVVLAAVAGMGASAEEQPAAAGGATWGAFWAGEDALGGTPAEELVQSLHSARSKVCCSWADYTTPQTCCKPFQ